MCGLIVTVLRTTSGGSIWSLRKLWIAIGCRTPVFAGGVESSQRALRNIDLRQPIYGKWLT